ncbi:CAP domain-containing protein [Dactylosporangium sp. NPDC000521]|uniref:CAP domain-containing protein n=1 Tax=Dactylosporangium sp. NPDC000521 TaxID=3363975 RepID=UPI0036868999
MSAFGPYDARNTEPVRPAYGAAPQSDGYGAPYDQGYGDGFGSGYGDDAADTPAPRHRRGTRLAVIVGVGVAALLVVGATAFGGAVLLGRDGDTGDAARTSVAGDATGDPANAGDPNAGDPSAGNPAGGTEGASATPEAGASSSSSAPASARPTKAQTTPPAKPKTTAAAPPGNLSYEQQVLVIVNSERAKAGCSPLAYNAKLATAARKHSQDMATNDYFSHTSQDGTSFATRITNAGYKWSGAAENIAKGQKTPADVMKAWMNSSGHRANILNCGLKDLGVGLAYQGKTPIWTQDFGSPR